jgi:putative transposase
MPRRPRSALGGTVFHVLNRGVRRATLFNSQGDYLAFESTLMEAVERRRGIRLLSFIIMPNHWHLIVWPTHDDDLSEFMRWLTVTHATRWHAKHGTGGTGPVYQGRYKSFAVQQDDYFFAVCRYCERNAKRANLVETAERWRFSSLWWRHSGQQAQRQFLSEWPLRRPDDWVLYVNQPQSQAELDSIRRCIKKGKPFGKPAWQSTIAAQLGIDLPDRSRGRPPKNNSRPQFQKLTPVPI